MPTQKLHINRDIIVATRRQNLRARADRIPSEAVLALAQMQERPRYLLATVEDPGQVTLIGQVTRTEMYDPVSTALRFVKEGADAISFFTDHMLYDNDTNDLLMVAKGLHKTPIIYQNYVLNEYGVMAARAADASAIMIYASLLSKETLRSVVTMTQRWKMTALVQVNSPDELARTIDLSPHTICYGDNLSRNIERTLDEFLPLQEQIPHHIKVMLTPAVQTLKQADAVIHCGVDALLVGEKLLKNEHKAAKLRRLVQHQS